MDLVDIGGRTASQEKFLRRMLQVKADKFSLPADLMDKMNLVNLENTRYPPGTEIEITPCSDNSSMREVRSEICLR